MEGKVIMTLRHDEKGGVMERKEGGYFEIRGRSKVGKYFLKKVFTLNYLLANGWHPETYSEGSILDIYFL